MSNNRNQQDASQPIQRIQKLLLHIGINVVATAVLFFLTVNDDDPFIAPISQLPMVMRWAIIAITMVFIQFCWVRGCKRGARDNEDITECPHCHGTGLFQPIPSDHRRLDQ